MLHTFLHPQDSSRDEFRLPSHIRYHIRGRYQKAAAANTIRSQLASIKADIEAQKASNALSIKDSYDKLATDTYNQELAAEQAAVTARNNQQQSDLDALEKILFSGDYTNQQKMLKIQQFGNKYPSASLDYLLGIAGISIDVYNNYIDSGHSSPPAYPIKEDWAWRNGNYLPKLAPWQKQ